MFKFNFAHDEEGISESGASEEGKFQWYQSKKITIPENLRDVIKNIPESEISKINYGDGVTCLCVSSKQVMKILKNKSGKKNLFDVLVADKQHSDLLPGKYEGGLKIWECTKDLALYFTKNVIEKNSFKLEGKTILDLGCGSGILGIICLKGGAKVTFQDYNEEVLEGMTIINIFLNFDDSYRNRVTLYSGDWDAFLKLLYQEDSSKFDYILTSETIYNQENNTKLIAIFKNLLRQDGVIYVAAKNHYFGVGGNLLEFENNLELNGFKSTVVWQVNEGVSKKIIEVKPGNTSSSRKKISKMTSTDNRKDANHVQNNHVRPRSLYTAHSYHGENDESNYPRYNDLTKYFDHSSTDQWNSTSRWRQLRSAGSKPTVVTPFFPTDDGPPAIYADKWREITDATEPSPGAAIATATGIMSLRLHDRLRVDMTIDKAIRVINVKNNIVLALSGSGSAAALMHPNGRVYQYGSRVEIVAHDINHGNNKYAKMWYKGVSFTSEQCALVYLVDTAGTRTTTDTFTDMTQDFSLSVFYAESRYGSQYIDDAIRLLEGAQYWVTDEGIENWIINNLRISQAPDGLLRIARNSNKYQIRTSPSNGTASLTTPFVHCTASLGQTSHLFVRRGERRMHYDGASFIVRNAGHSAGFDDKNQLKVY